MTPRTAAGFDRDAGGRSESGQQLLIFGTESTTDMINQVELAEDLVAWSDWNAKEPFHLRMVGREFE